MKTKSEYNLQMDSLTQQEPDWNHRSGNTSKWSQSSIGGEKKAPYPPQETVRLHLRLLGSERPFVGLYLNLGQKTEGEAEKDWVNNKRVEDAWGTD